MKTDDVNYFLEKDHRHHIGLVKWSEWLHGHIAWKHHANHAALYCRFIVLLYYEQEY
jgi:hypothetical protein